MYTKEIMMEIRRLRNALNDTHDDSRAGFSILKFNAPERDIISVDPMRWVFCVDRSGSMSLISEKDNKSRLDHVKSTLIKIVEYLKDLCIQDERRLYLIDVIWFNGSITTSHIKINSSRDITAFIKEINDITSSGMTNMCEAIRKASQIITRSPRMKSNMVVLSDGEITSGISEPEYILKSVNESNQYLVQDFTAVFVGYGTEQSSNLLSILAKTPNGEYHCVESAEGAGIVYGEIVHSSLYQSIKDMNLEVIGGQIYDYDKNIWSNSLLIGKIAGGLSRVWHLHHDLEPETPLSVKATYNSYCISDEGDSWIKMESVSPAVISPDVGSIDKECYQYYLRQQVLELLAESKEYTTNVNDFAMRITPPPAPRIRRQPANTLPFYESVEINTHQLYSDHQSTGEDLFEPPPILGSVRVGAVKANNSPAVSPPESPGQILRKKLLCKMEEIKSYINEEGDDSGILRTLCDDLYVCALALKSTRGLTYILARQASQGNQRAYNATGTDYLEDDTNTGHEMSCNMVSPYASQQAEKIIREVSAPF